MRPEEFKTWLEQQNILTDILLDNIDFLLHTWRTDYGLLIDEQGRISEFDHHEEGCGILNPASIWLHRRGDKYHELGAKSLIILNRMLLLFHHYLEDRVTFFIDLENRPQNLHEAENRFYELRAFIYYLSRVVEPRMFDLGLIFSRIDNQLANLAYSISARIRTTILPQLDEAILKSRTPFPIGQGTMPYRFTARLNCQHQLLRASNPHNQIAQMKSYVLFPVLTVGYHPSHQYYEMKMIPTNKGIMQQTPMDPDFHGMYRQMNKLWLMRLNHPEEFADANLAFNSIFIELPFLHHEVDYEVMLRAAVHIAITSGFHEVYVYPHPNQHLDRQLQGMSFTAMPNLRNPSNWGCQHNQIFVLPLYNLETTLFKNWGNTISWKEMLNEHPVIDPHLVPFPHFLGHHASDYALQRGLSLEALSNCQISRRSACRPTLTFQYQQMPTRALDGENLSRYGYLPGPTRDGSTHLCRSKTMFPVLSETIMSRKPRM